MPARLPLARTYVLVALFTPFKGVFAAVTRDCQFNVMIFIWCTDVGGGEIGTSRSPVATCCCGDGGSCASRVRCASPSSHSRDVPISSPVSWAAGCTQPLVSFGAPLFGDLAAFRCCAPCVIALVAGRPSAELPVDAPVDAEALLNRRTACGAISPSASLSSSWFSRGIFFFSGNRSCVASYLTTRVEIFVRPPFSPPSLSPPLPAFS